MHTVGHGTRPAAELVETLVEVGVRTVVDVRRFPGSRRNPQFDRGALETSLARAGIGCHRWLIAELLAARGYDVLHLIRPGDSLRHRPWAEAEAREGRLFLCGELVA